MNIFIPTCGESKYLIPLIRQLREHADIIHVVANNMDHVEAVRLIMDCRYEGVEASYSTETNIYTLWNMGIHWGQQVSNFTAILNDDVEIDGMTLPQMERALVTTGYAILGWDWVHMNMCNLDRIQPVQGTYRKGGVGGFAFAINPKLVQPVDTRFGWWGGDDDLVYQTLANGHQVGLAIGLGVVHHHSTSSTARPEVLESIGRDRELLLSKWGDSW